MKINQGIAEVLEDPNTMYYLAHKLIRRKPKAMPWFVWKAFLWVVLAPAAKKPMRNPDAS